MRGSRRVDLGPKRSISASRATDLPAMGHEIRPQLAHRPTAADRQSALIAEDGKAAEEGGEQRRLVDAGDAVEPRPAAGTSVADQPGSRCSTSCCRVAT